MMRLQKQTSIPFGLSRFVLISIVAVFCMINGPVVLNWPPIRSMYVRAGVYSWLCDGNSNEGLIDALSTVDELSCPDQRKALALLATMGQTLMFAGSVLGGLIADKFGPKAAVVGGSSLFALHYLMIAISSQKFQLYIPAYICQGFAIEMNYFGALNVSNLFPRNKAFAMSIMGTFRSMAMAYCLAQRSVSINLNLQTTNLICMALAVVVGIVASIVMPKKSFLFIQDDDDQYFSQIMSKDDQSVGDISAAIEDAERSSIIVVSASKTPSTVSSGAIIVGDLKSICFDDDKLRRKEDWLALKDKVLKPVYFAWLMFFTVAYARFTFFGISLQDQMPEAVRAYSILSPLSFIPCPLLGYLADRVGMVWVISWLNIVGTAIYVCLLIGDNPATRWISVLGASCVASFLASQNYCYIAKSYPDRLAGRLAGVAMFVAGLVSLVNTPLYNWATDKDRFATVDWIWLSLSILLFGCIALIILRRKQTMSDPISETRRKQEDLLQNTATIYTKSSALP